MNLFDDFDKKFQGQQRRTGMFINAVGLMIGLMWLVIIVCFIGLIWWASVNGGDIPQMIGAIAGEIVKAFNEAKQ